MEKIEVLEQVVERMKNYIIEKVPEGQLISLYLAGRILTEDRAPTSDIEIFGIVADDFDPETERKINEFFEKHPEFCGNRECKFHAFYLSDFEGRTSNKSPLCKSTGGIGFWKRMFKFYKHIWGKKFDFDRFPVKEMSYIDELKMDLEILKKNIENAKKYNYTWPEDAKYKFQGLVKFFMHVIRLHKVVRGELPYMYSFTEFEKRAKDPLFTELLKIRMMGEDAEKLEKVGMRKRIVKEAEKYVKKVETELEKQKQNIKFNKQIRK